MLRTLATAGLAAALIAAPAAFAAQGDGDDGPRPKAQTIAVIGDIPYGDAQIADFPADLAQIAADPDVRRVIHLGDIKNGSSPARRGGASEVRCAWPGRTRGTAR